MKTRYLFPHSLKKVGWVLLIPSLLIAMATVFQLIQLPEWPMRVLSFISNEQEKTVFFVWQNNSISDELLASVLIIGALLVACSKEKREDEFIAKIRLESLLWATYINYALLLLAILLVYEGYFLEVMQWNMFTLLIIFLVRFHFVLYSATRSARHEE